MKYLPKNTPYPLLLPNLLGVAAVVTSSDMGPFEE